MRILKKKKMRTIKRVSHWEFHPTVRSGNERTFGEKAADVMRHGMGSWPFVFAFVLMTTVWMTYNCLVNPSKAFDPYPFILLNLAFSILAGLQGAILLIAAKRADRIASELAAYHLSVSEEHKLMLAELKKLLESRINQS